MGRHTFSPGVRFRLRGEWFVVREILLDRKFLVESQSLGGKTTIGLDELEQAMVSNDLIFEPIGPHVKIVDLVGAVPIDYTIQDFDSITPDRREEALRLYRIIRPILDWPVRERTRKKFEKYVKELRAKEGYVTVLSATGERLPPRKGITRGKALSRSLVEKKLKVYINSGQDLRSLVDLTDRIGRPGESRLDTEAEQVISNVLDYCNKNRQQRTNETIHLMVVNRIAIENRSRPAETQLITPGPSTIYNRIHTNGLEHLLRRRQSLREEHAKEPVLAGPDPTRIMQRVEFDGTWLDLIVVDEEDRLPIGRPWFSYAIDKYSGYILGFYVGFEHPGYKTTMSCAYNAFSIKPDARQWYGTKNNWLARGYPELSIIDNGPEYVNQHLAVAFGMLGIPYDQCPVNTPWVKASVERYLRTQCTGLIHMLPGTTFSNIVARGDYESEREACISLPALIRILHVFILDFYHQRWNKGVKGFPQKLWMASEGDGYIPCYPVSQAALQVTLFRNEVRTLQGIGIEYETIKYQSHDLARLRTLLRKDEREVSIRVNPDDLSYVYILDPITKSEWIRFYPDDPMGYTHGLSLWKHRLILRELNAQKRTVDLVALAEAKATIQKIVEEEYSSQGKTLGRKSSKLYLTSPSALQLPASIPASQDPVLPPSLETVTSQAAEPVDVHGETMVNHSKTPDSIQIPAENHKTGQASVSPSVLPPVDQELDDTGYVVTQYKGK